MLSSFLCFLLSSSALWSAPDIESLQQELAPFLREPPGETTVISKDDMLTFDNVIEILRHSSDPIRNYLEQCDQLAWQELPFAQPIVLPKTPLSIYIGEGPTGDTNYLFGALRFYLAQRLVQARLFDEAKHILADLTPENSIEPANVLILKAVVHHHFSDREEGLAALKDFNAVSEQHIVSRRASELAKLLQFEWERQEKAEGTQSISRQMDDIRRRLGQGRTDEETQDAEEDVMQSLEKLIEQIEEQANQMREHRNAQQSGQPEVPPEDLPAPSDLKGAGNVDRRNFSFGDSWGDLPPREREEALLRIEREFPAYYREIIEQYFREMAR